MILGQKKEGKRVAKKGKKGQENDIKIGKRYNQGYPGILDGQSCP